MEKKAVVVALVPVALVKVKFWRVVEPVRRRLERVAESEVMDPVVRVPRLAEVEKRLVLEAVVEKKEVVVAEAPVAVVKPREVKEPVGPETVAPVRVGLVKLPLSLRVVKMALLLSESLSLCLVMDW